MKNLTRHIKRHEGKKNSDPCPVCGKTFESQKYMKKHLLIHEDKKRFSCDLCHKTFNSPDYVRKHIGVAHGINKTVVDVTPNIIPEVTIPAPR